MDTKQLILEEALRQFSQNGYAATSMSDIAKPLGISKAALYKHFSGKQQIFERIIEDAEGRYSEFMEHLSVHILAGTTKNVDDRDVSFYGGVNAKALADKVIELVEFSMDDTYTRQVRHMLTMAQFQSEELGRMYSVRYAETMARYDEQLFSKLMENGVMKKDDPRQMALYFASPIILFMGVIDREPDRRDEVVAEIRKHVEHFFEMTHA